MDELTAIIKARQFVSDIDFAVLKNDLRPLVEKINASVKYERLDVGESGFTFTKRGSQFIVINTLESIERQRFTLCHEIAHVVLNLPSEHDVVKSSSFVKRHENEVFCDCFAAELLLPYVELKKDLRDAEPSFALAQQLSEKYLASFPATAMRVALLCDFPCAFVHMESGLVRYITRSTRLRNLNAWIPLKTPIPQGSVAWDLRETKQWQSEPVEVSQDVWFSNWSNADDLVEESRYYQNYDQGFSLLWFDDADAPPTKNGTSRMLTKEVDGLDELTGHLTWRKR